MKNVWLILKREYITKVRNKSFILMTFLSPIAVIVLSLLIGYLSNLNKDRVKEILIVDETYVFSETFESDKNIRYKYNIQNTLQEAKVEALEKELYGVLYIPNQLDKEDKSIEFFSEEAPTLFFVSELETKIENTLFYYNLKQKDIDFTIIDASKESIDIKLQKFSGEKTSELANLLKYIFGGGAGYLLMMFIVIYGNMIMRSVIEEKTNRIIEIIISSVKPIQLMLGKIIGTSLVGITQFVLWMIIGSILMTLFSSIMGINTYSTEAISELDGEFMTIINEILIEFFQFPILKLIVSFLLYFIGGYLLYSSLYAAIGSAVDNETDTQQFLFPIMLPLILAIYVGFLTSAEDSNGSISVLLSHIPFTSPILMLMRIPYGVSWAEIILSLVILYASFFVILWISSKIYRIGILMYGNKPSYKEIYKWIRSKG